MADKIDVVGDRAQAVGYAGCDGRLIAVREKGQELETAPPGTVYVQEATTVTNVIVEGKPAKGYLVVEGPKMFLRGHLVTADQPEFERLAVLYLGQRIDAAIGGGGGMQILSLEMPAALIVVTQYDGTERVIPFNDGDVAPPAGASPYAVGESPDELEAARLERIRRDVEAGVYGDPGDEDDFDDEDLLFESEAYPDVGDRIDREEDFDDAEEEDEHGLTPSDYSDGATVGVCPDCLRTHALRPGVVGLTDEQAAVERQRRGAGEVPYAEVGGEA